VGDADARRALQIGQGAGHAEDPIVGAAAHGELLPGGHEQRAAIRIGAGHASQGPAAQLGVDGGAGGLRPVPLELPGRDHPLRQAARWRRVGSPTIA